MIFMMTGTKDMGRTFDGSEGLPGLMVGWTKECFHSLGLSHQVMHVLTMCRTTPPIAGNPVLIFRIHTPSAPRAAEFCIWKIARPSSSSEIVLVRRLHAPTRGSRTFRLVVAFGFGFEFRWRSGNPRKRKMSLDHRQIGQTEHSDRPFSQR